jgi:hypothetical protein
LTSIPHASALPSSASRAGPSPPCRAAPRASALLLPAEQRHARRPCRAAPLLAGPVEQQHSTPATGPSPVQHLCVGPLRHDRPPTGTADTEAAALEAAAATAAPSFDVQPQELAVRLAKEKGSAAATERQAAYDAALARLAQAEEEAANASKARDAAIACADRERARAATAAAVLQPSTPVESSAGGSASSMF